MKSNGILYRFFASTCLLILLLASPVLAQEGTSLLPGGPLRAQEQTTEPQPAPPAKPKPILLPDIFRLLFKSRAQFTPAELEEIYDDVWEQVGESYHTPSALKDWSNWEHKYKGKLSKPEDLEKALRELLATLSDRWTVYISADEIAQARQDALNGIVELGVELKRQADGSYRVDYIAYGSPAHKSDLRKGDLIKSIGGKDLMGLSQEEVDKLLKGKSGTKVAVVYIDNGKSVSLDLTFAATAAARVEHRLLPDNIGYVRLPDFSSQRTIADFLAAVEDLNTQAKDNLSGLVLDLRGNPGGQFQLAILVSSLFLEKGTIVTGTTRSGRLVSHETYEVIPDLPHTLKDPPTDFQKVTKILKTKPLSVLTDGSTASAAEIVTGALKDNGRAIIVGGTTYGKGVGYVRYNLPTGGILLVTTLDYLTPSGFNLSDKGLAPHRAVDQPRGSAVDEQLNGAVKAVKDQLLTPSSPSAKPTEQSSDYHRLRHVIRIAILVVLLLLLNLRRSRLRG